MNNRLNRSTIVTDSDGGGDSADENEDEETGVHIKHYYHKQHSTTENNDYMYGVHSHPSQQYYRRQRHSHQLLTKRARLFELTSEQETFHNLINTTDCSQLQQQDSVVTLTNVSSECTTNTADSCSNESNNGIYPHSTFRSLLFQSDYNLNDHNSSEKENLKSTLSLKNRLNQYVSDTDDNDEHVDGMSESASDLILHEAHNIGRFPLSFKDISHVDCNHMINDQNDNITRDKLNNFKG
ncbi:Suppressor of hairless protein [Schistosoma japonicum]|nr:Suppressor of hairless protein [Schistosoma japonicum]